MPDCSLCLSVLLLGSLEQLLEQVLLLVSEAAGYSLQKELADGLTHLPTHCGRCASQEGA